MSLLSGKDAGNHHSSAAAGTNWDSTLAIIERWKTENADPCTQTTLLPCSDISSPPAQGLESSDAQNDARQSDLAHPLPTQSSDVSQFIAQTRPKQASVASSFIPPMPKATNSAALPQTPSVSSFIPPIPKATNSTAPPQALLASSFIPPIPEATSSTAPPHENNETPIAASTSLPSEVRKGGKVREADITPGIYTVTYEGTSVEASVERGSSAIASLPKGSIINVLEIVPLYAVDRIRARIAKPPGWISLVQPSNGARWAKKASAACLSVASESKTQNHPETASTSDSSVPAVNEVKPQPENSITPEAVLPQCAVPCEEKPTLVQPSPLASWPPASAPSAPVVETTLKMTDPSAITSAETMMDSACPVQPAVGPPGLAETKTFSKASSCCIAVSPQKPDVPPKPAVVGTHFSKAASVSHVVASNACQANVSSQSGGNVGDADSSLGGAASMEACENSTHEKLDDAALNKTAEPHWDSWDAEAIDDTPKGDSDQDVSWAIVPLAPPKHGEDVSELAGDDKPAKENFKLPPGVMPVAVESVCQPEPEPLPDSTSKFELFGLPRHGVAIYKGAPADVHSFFAAIKDALLPHGPGKCRFENIDISGVNLKPGAVGELLDVLSKSGATTQRLKAYRCDLGDEAVLSLVNWMTWLTCDGLPHEVHLSKNRITVVGMRRLIDCIKAKFPSTRPAIPIWLRIEENCIEKDFIESLFTDDFACRAEKCTTRSCSEMGKNLTCRPYLHLKHARNQKRATQVALLKTSTSEPQKHPAAPPLMTPPAAPPLMTPPTAPPLMSPPPPPSASSFPVTTWPPGFGPQFCPIGVYPMPPLPPPVAQSSSRREPEIGADWHLPVIPRISSDGVPVAARVPIAVAQPQSSQQGSRGHLQRSSGRRRSRTRSQRKQSRRRSRRGRSRSSRSRSRRRSRRRSRSRKKDRSRSRSQRSSRRRSRSRKKDRSRSRSRKKNRSRSRSRRSSRRRSRSRNKDRRRSRSHSHSRSPHRSRSGCRGAARGVSHERFGSDTPTEIRLIEEKELIAMNLKQLKAEARKMKITDEIIEACDEEDDTKAAMIKLIQNRQESAALENLEKQKAAGKDSGSSGASVDETTMIADCGSEEREVFEKKLAVAMDIRLRVNDLFKCME